MSRVLVCGGRDYADRRAVEDALCRLDSAGDVVVTGGARGADTLAHEVAQTMGFDTEVYPADWNAHGRAAGPIRNQQMLDTGIDRVIAFPGGRGTDDMVTRACKAGVPVEVRP